MTQEEYEALEARAIAHTQSQQVKGLQEKADHRAAADDKPEATPPLNRAVWP
jgi:hypothetical protein